MTQRICLAGNVSARAEPTRLAPAAMAPSAVMTSRRCMSMASVSTRRKIHVNDGISMPEHQTPLIATIAAGLMLAYLFGLIAHRLRIQPLVGYLVAGVAVGPFTPGFTADPALAAELAEIGVIL